MRRPLPARTWAQDGCSEPGGPCQSYRQGWVGEGVRRWGVAHLAGHRRQQAAVRHVGRVCQVGEGQQDVELQGWGVLRYVFVAGWIGGWGGWDGQRV